jgi:hypothetical protein
VALMSLVRSIRARLFLGSHAWFTSKPSSGLVGP